MAPLILESMVIVLAAALGLWALPWRSEQVRERWSAFGTLAVAFMARAKAQRDTGMIAITAPALRVISGGPTHTQRADTGEELPKLASSSLAASSVAGPPARVAAI